MERLVLVRYFYPCRSSLLKRKGSLVAFEPDFCNETQAPVKNGRLPAVHFLLHLINLIEVPFLRVQREKQPVVLQAERWL